MTRARRVWNVSVIGAIFGVLGLLVGAVALPARTEVPRPYTVPFVQGGSSLRIAMIHDVLHERYSKHGAAWYRERERRSREALAAAGDVITDEQLRVMDDLGVALDRQGRPDEATAVLREKVAHVERLHGPRPGSEGALPTAWARFDFMATRELGPAELAWYRTCANLGTTLIHGSFAQARAGDAAAKERLREGLAWIRRSIAVNPGAHFGREVWQAGAVGFLLATCDDPMLLTRYDLIGQSLAPGSDEADDAAVEWHHRSRLWWRSYERSHDVLDAWTDGRVPAAELPAALDTVWEYRTKSILPVGVADGWPGREAAGLEGPAPFDEPVLGVLGMWTLGGGPNPFSALTLAGVCERIGQKSVAWTGYARALGLAERFGSNAEVRDALVAHCRARQAALLPDAELSAKQQAKHEAELAFGLLFQELRAKFEEERIAAGADLDDPGFFVAFDRDFEEQYGPIASPVGPIDRARVALDGGTPRLIDLASVVLLAFGLGAALGHFRR